MADLGFIRRIDELGRVVIPKDIRNMLKVKSGDSLEVYADKDNIVLKKYDMFDNMSFICNVVSKCIYERYGFDVLICNRKGYISCVGGEFEGLRNQHISKDMESMFDNFTDNIKDGVFNFSSSISYSGTLVFYPIVVLGEIVGFVVILGCSKDVLDVVSAFADFLGLYLE